MRNNIAYFEKTSRSRVKIMEKINKEFIFAFNFTQNITLLLLVFSKEAILFLIYLLADKAICQLCLDLLHFSLKSIKSIDNALDLITTCIGLHFPFKSIKSIDNHLNLITTCIGLHTIPFPFPIKMVIIHSLKKVKKASGSTWI